MDLIGELSKSLGSSDFEVSKSSPNDPNKPHPRFSQYKNRGQLSSRQSDQGNFFYSTNILVKHNVVLNEPYFVY